MNDRKSFYARTIMYILSTVSLTSTMCLMAVVVWVLQRNRSDGR